MNPTIPLLIAIVGIASLLYGLFTLMNYGEIMQPARHPLMGSAFAFLGDVLLVSGLVFNAFENEKRERK